ncbi:MAG TPA: hypothetical protein DCW90_19345 [Lachnospiraceae bacterium]|nr:hypothetical protein [uncultured Lachnoclostridium sp.]HAU87560.1 hypothetical protein [Lachnospiraceae bacterium]
MNRMIEFWNDEKQYFTDCRLDSYYMVMKFLKKNIDPAKMFISAGITNEQCMVISIRYKDNVIKTPIILNSERGFEEDLCKFWNVNYHSIRSDDGDTEVQLIQDTITKGTPVIVEIISLFLQNKNLRQKSTVLSGVSTSAIIGYDSDGFTLGIKDAFSNKLIHISYEQYRKARESKCIPFAPRHEIVFLESGNGEIRDPSDDTLKKNWLEQVKRLYNLNGLYELNTKIKECLKEIDNVEKPESFCILKTQLTLIAKSLCKGSYGGFYYELANSGYQLGYITEPQMQEMKEIGLAWKKCYLTLEKLINKFKARKEIDKFRQAVDSLIMIKHKYLKCIIEKENKESETIINNEIY